MRKERRMIMNTKTYTTLPQEAKGIRIEVFVKNKALKTNLMKSTLLVIILLPLMKENPSEHVVSSKKTITIPLEGWLY